MRKNANGKKEVDCLTCLGLPVNYPILFFRSVRIEGTVEKVSKEISQAYFESRPVGSQIGAAVSNQSQVIPNRGHLLEKEAQLKSVYGDGSQKMEKPEEWGGTLFFFVKFRFSKKATKFDLIFHMDLTFSTHTPC